VKKDVRLLFSPAGEGSWRAAVEVPEDGGEAAVTAYFRSMHREVLTEPIPQALLDAIEPLRGRDP
jgi:hypothetical protein